MGSKAKKEKIHLDEPARNRRTLRNVFRVLPLIFLIAGALTIPLLFLEVIPAEAGTAVSFAVSGIVDAVLLLFCVYDLFFVFANYGSGRKFGVVCCFLGYIALTVYAAYAWSNFFIVASEYTALASSGGSAETLTALTEQKRFIALHITLAQVVRYIAFAVSTIVCHAKEKQE